MSEAKNEAPTLTLGERAERQEKDAETARRRAAQWSELERGAVKTQAESRAEELVKVTRSAWRSAPTVQAPARDFRRVSWGMVLSDLRAVVKLTTRGFTKDQRETLTTDAAVLIYRWSEHGAERYPLGGADDAPLLRDWRELDDTRRPMRRLTPGALKAARAAVKQAAQRPDAIARAAEHETPESALPLGSIGELAERAHVDAERDSDRFSVPVPTPSAAPILAELLSLSERGARALIADAYRLTPDDAADLFGIARSAIASILSKGRADVRRRYPDPVDLLDCLADAAPRYRALCSARAVLALAEYRAGETDAESALDAVQEWRSVSAHAPAQTVALEGAAQRAIVRHSGGWSPERAERIAQAIGRIIPAESARAYRSAKLGKIGSHLSGAATMAPTPSAAELDAEHVRRSAICASAIVARAETIGETRSAIRAVRFALAGAQVRPLSGAERAELVAREHAEHAAALAL